MIATIQTVTYDITRDVVIAGVYRGETPIARVELRIAPTRVAFSCEYLDALEDVSGHSQTMLPARVVDALFNACTCDDEILYVPSETVLPLTITL